MSSLIGAVELLRGHGQLPPSGNVSLRDLVARFRPDPPGSVRALLWKMHEGGSTKLPWAVILCRFKGDPPNPAVEGPLEQFYREAFQPGSGGLVEYWRDASLGAIDISASKVYGWYEIDIARANAGIGPPPGPGRAGLVDAAIRAAQAAHVDPVTGFYGQIAVYTQNWSNDDPARPPGTPSWTQQDPLMQWWPTWIDGGSYGLPPSVLTPPHDGNISAHEMGHGLGMGHDVGPDLSTASDYSDPCCIMSQNGGFTHPRWGRNFGPALCLVHLVQKGWMYPRRLYRDDGAWQDNRDGVAIPLAPLSRPAVHANLGIVLPYSNGAASWDYYLEYVIPTEWNRGVAGAPYLFVRRIVNIKGQDRPAYLGAVAVPTAAGVPADFIEPQGNVLFRIELTSLPGPILKVIAKKL
jgi:hypothetical protein